MFNGADEITFADEKTKKTLDGRDSKRQKRINADNKSACTVHILSIQHLDYSKAVEKAGL